MKEVLKAIFPQLNDDNLLNEIIDRASLKEYSKDQILVNQDSLIRNIPLVTKGEVKVLKIDYSGAGVYLYSLYRGDICAMSVSCCIQSAESKLKAVAAEDTEVLEIPSRFMDEWLVKYQVWRSFIFGNYRSKFDELIDSINSIAFTKLDERLERYIRNRSQKNNNEISITHQQIADELNSTREVISRLLKQMESKGKIELKRNYIRLLK